MFKRASSLTFILLLIVALLSFWLRVWGIQFGLPFAYHPDEQQYILPAVGFVSGNFKPLAFYNPTLYPYLIGLVYTLVYLGLHLFGAFPAVFDLNAAWSPAMLPWTAGLIYLARFTSVAAGVLTTLLIYQLGRRAYSRETGLGAALMFGLTFLPAREAHFAVSDTPVALAVTAALYFCVRIVRRGRRPDYWAAGLALGLATATKYSAGLLLLPLAAAHLLSRRYHTWPERLRALGRPVLAGLIAIAAYLLVSPYTLLEYQEFWADFSENLGSARAGFQGLSLDPTGSGAIFYLRGLAWGLGWPLLGLSLLAVAFALWRRRRVDLVLLSLPLLGFFYMQRQEMYFVRWLVPFLPPLTVLAAETAHAGARRLAPARLGYPAFLAIILLCTLPSAYMSGRANQVFCRPDTRSQALAWIQQNIPPGSHLAVEVLSPPWGPPLTAPGLPLGPYLFAPVPDGGVTEVDLQQYRDWGAQYVIASSFHYARPLRNKARQQELAGRLEVLDRQAELVVVFEPYLSGHGYKDFFYHDQVYGPANDTLYRQRPGPVIKIYRLPNPAIPE